MQTNFVITTHRYSRISYKGYLVMAMICLLIASTIGA